jgi:type II secretory pathway component PulF
MSAGGLFGLFMNMFIAAALWMGIGAVVDRIGAIFNQTINMLPSFQDAVNGFSITQTIWSFLLVIIFIALSINYLINENSLSSGEV